MFQRVIQKFGIPTHATYFKTRKPFLCNKKEEEEKYRERHLQIKSFLFKFALGQMQFSPIFESCQLQKVCSKAIQKEEEEEERGFLIEFSVKQTLFTKEFIITEFSSVCLTVCTTLTTMYILGSTITSSSLLSKILLKFHLIF